MILLRFLNDFLKKSLKHLRKIIFPLARRDPTVQVADPARDPLRTAWTPASALPSQ